MTYAASKSIEESISVHSPTITICAALALALTALVGCASKSDPISQAARADKAAGVPVPSLAETKAIAEEAFIYGLPIVMNYAVMNEYAIDKGGPQFKAAFNQIKNEPRVYTYQDTAVITPNSDTPYSILWMDLRTEPIVLSVPAVEKRRYYSVMLNDGNTYNFGYIGSRATGNGPGSYMVVGPDWKGETPPGVRKVFTSTTPFAAAVYRTQLFNPKDMSNVVKVQSGYKVQPLSAFLDRTAPPAAPSIKFVPATTAGIKDNFYEYLDAALQFVPPSAEDRDVRARIARIGIGPGKTFEFKDLALEHKGAVLLGMKAGDEKVDKWLATGIKNVNGWNIGSFFGDRNFYKGNWLMRAGAAKGGIYGNDAIEAAYPLTRVDEKGQPLDGSKHDYTLTFPAGQTPPVNAFWSVTMYDGKTQLLIKNPINRYLINSPMVSAMKKNRDGSLTLYIQKDSPGKALEANWLPAPDGPIYLAMRLYWPKDTPPSILPAGEGTWKPPGIVASN
ncbi:DUF1254 domain-containing protein [Variovorax saccharolyticus]|uniref:DUF1254 domain-containing protein n=1 Tax=Variovorax saccharolyticus TaxID=3053516 RepID=UPI00257709A0|nr:DUF1254 domain-containing protein [Variovorax sp. J22R187]MDM0022511.1 DUF1254 domain-containing protein [Variovorax sp. J22R187]